MKFKQQLLVVVKSMIEAGYYPKYKGTPENFADTLYKRLERKDVSAQSHEAVERTCRELKIPISFNSILSA